MCVSVHQISEEISNGSLVGFRKTDSNQSVQTQLDSWVKIYGRGPFLVNFRLGNYISLEDMEGKNLPLGQGEGMINIKFVEQWKP